MHDETISYQAMKCFDGGFRKMLEEDGELDSDEDEALDSEEDVRMDGAWEVKKLYVGYFERTNFVDLSSVLDKESVDLKVLVQMKIYQFQKDSL